VSDKENSPASQDMKFVIVNQPLLRTELVDIRAFTTP
jgi:hypothetical protein